jgi:gluconokinase
MAVMIVVVLGVAGAGKTTVGTMLADRHDWLFIDGDDLHPPANVAKMRAGVPLDDADRDPWIGDLRETIRRVTTHNEDAVVACSALRASHRARLREAGDVRFVYLKVDYATACGRLLDRPGHFMPATLLQSQFDALQEPHNALIVDGRQAPASITMYIAEWLRQSDGAGINAAVSAQEGGGRGAGT